MIFPIYIYGSSALRAESVDIDASYPEIKKLISDMFDTMYASEGVGLAAPQVGKNIRLFVIDAAPMLEDEEEEMDEFKRVMINPEIIDESDEEVLMGEGCLSLPGIREDVWRPEKITVKYLDENFEEHEETLSGWPARVVQHEYDHIEGEVFTDHLAPLRKTLLKSKLAAMSKGKYRADYKSKLAK